MDYWRFPDASQKISGSKVNVLDLFSGIGGFSLGLERAGMRTVAFCEIDPFCQAVLRKHWPNVPIYDDITTLTAARLAADGIHAGSVANANISAGTGRGNPLEKQASEGLQYSTALFERSCIDLICGGFPCQDISFAGKGAGIEGGRSGLWKEYARIIGELRPRYVIVENVAALLGRGLGVVLGNLAAFGYDAEWHCIPASAVGAPHRRDRLWLVAYPFKLSEWRGAGWREATSGRSCDEPQGSSEHTVDVADTGRSDVEGQWLASRIQAEPNSFSGSSWWLTEPNVGRVAHGVPARVDRLRSLGNAIVPQIAEIIGRSIIDRAAD